MTDAQKDGSRRWQANWARPGLTVPDGARKVQMVPDWARPSQTTLTDCETRIPRGTAMTFSDSHDLRPRLVAETDASGKVAHVWLSMPDWRFARPIGSQRGAAMLQAGVVAQAEVHGASRGEISAWLRRKGLHGT